MGTATAKLTSAAVSPLKSRVVIDLIRGKNIAKAKNLLNGLLDEKISIKGKQYTKTAQTLLQFLESAEANAKQNKLNTEKLFIKTISADKGPKSFKGRTRWRFRGRKKKSANLNVILEER